MSTRQETITGAGRVRPLGDGGPVAALQALVATRRDLGPLVLRLTLAIVFFPHGAQKMLGWFGGPGFAGEVELLTSAVGLAPVIAVLVILIEFFAPLALAVGLGSRLAAVGLAAVMVGATLTVHLPFGFFMDWAGTQGGEGFEYHLLVLGMTLAVMLKGSGAFSLDRLLAERIPRS